MFGSGPLDDAQSLHGTFPVHHDVHPVVTAGDIARQIEDRCEALPAVPVLLGEDLYAMDALDAHFDALVGVLDAVNAQVLLMGDVLIVVLFLPSYYQASEHPAGVCDGFHVDAEEASGNEEAKLAVAAEPGTMSAFGTVFLYLGEVMWDKPKVKEVAEEFDVAFLTQLWCAGRSN